MSKSRTFSIYLLKEGFDISNALKEDHSLQGPVAASNLPSDAKLYVMDSDPAPPWWKNFWGVEQNLHQVLKGAIAFLTVQNRCFALTFGHTYHQLKDESYEYDFGLITTLNALDPNKIKSTDILQPENAKRERKQSPTASSLTFFDINKDESIIKKLTGAVKTEYQSFLSNITGASNLRITSKVSASEITELCRKVLEIYKKEDFKETFPDIQNIVPIKDPALVATLNSKLEEAFNNKSVDFVFSVPEMIDHEQSFYIAYSGAGRSKLYFDDVYVDNYRAYLEEKEVESITFDDLKNHKINFNDENDSVIKSFPIIKSILFECELNSAHYHFCEGEWYRIENNYLEKISSCLDPICADYSILADCDKKIEADYNKNIAENNGASVICLDQKNIASSGNVEPCDLYILEDGKAILAHIKISTRSSSLSHLFNQGINSMQLIRIDAESKEKLFNLLPAENFKAPIENQKIEVIFGIITAKDKEKKSKNLPIFSRISLVRTINSLRLMAIPCRIVFIKDLVDRKRVNTDEEVS